MKAKIAGIKFSSMVDVPGKITTTVWFCGCSLRCPFCHNWKIANVDPSVCHDVSLDEFVKRLDVPSLYGSDYLHFTGGEPLLFPYFVRNTSEYFGRKVPISVNTSFHVSQRNVEIGVVENNYVVHVAFDVKVPYEEMTGGSKLFHIFKENLRYVIETRPDIFFEVRIPVSTFTWVEEVVSVLKELKIDEVKRKRIYVFPLTKTMLQPRDPLWPGFKEKLLPNEVSEWKKALSQFSKDIVIKQKWFS